VKKWWLATPAALVLLGFLPQPEKYFTVPENWPKPDYDFSKNELTAEKIALGRALFYDPLLSSNGQVSCASCHSQYTAFSHVDHKLSHGIFDRIGTRNAPGLFNLAWQKSFMWDGAVNHLDAQGLAPIENQSEMGESIGHVVKKLNALPRYRRAFLAAYGDSVATGTRTLRAISQFMLTLVSADSKYDKVMRHETAFNPYEAHGYGLFLKNCASCHAEPLFTNGKFEDNGLAADSVLRDCGRMKITFDRRDSLRFKVPSLRNVEVTYPYMHDGRFASLQMVLFHYTEGIVRRKGLSKPLRKRIDLTEADKRDLIAFLKTLTDENFLRDKRFSYPRDFFAASEGKPETRRLSQKPIK
jgi:cytochrome c peroxidase